VLQDFLHHPYLALRKLGLLIHPLGDLHGGIQIARQRRGLEPGLQLGLVLPVPLIPRGQMVLGR
jgi:hypothetical protein